MSPFFRPVGYAAAIDAVDGILWYCAPLDVMGMVDGQEAHQMLVRAAFFRLVAASEKSLDLLEDLNGLERVAEALSS